jgi:FMN phosphatase YigB (HAD superfamily)
MIKFIISDFSKVLLFPKDKNYAGKLNDLHKKNLESGGYDFWKHFELDQKLFDYYKTLSKNYELFIFTSEYIQDYPPVRQILDTVFRKIFIAFEMNVKKDDPIAYQKLSDLLDCSPEEIIYIDDSQANVDAANKVRMNAILYKTADSTISKITKKLSSDYSMYKDKLDKSQVNSKFGLFFYV